MENDENVAKRRKKAKKTLTLQNVQSDCELWLCNKCRINMFKSL